MVDIKKKKMISDQQRKFIDFLKQNIVASKKTKKNK